MFRYACGMGTDTHTGRGPRPGEIQDYSVLRQTGTPPARARRLIGLGDSAAKELEAAFKVRQRRPGDRERPKFARHDAHVASVLREGGFSAFSERPLGKGMYAICLPMIRSGSRGGA
jgi:hypothetical protein